MTSSNVEEKKSPTLLSLILSLIVPFTVVMVLQFFFFNNYWVPSASMEPTLMVQDKVFGTRLVNYEPTRGDIVVFKDDNRWLTPEGDQNLVKRIIAVGGDTVECCSATGQVTVNGEALEEPYEVGENETFPTQVVPEGYVFVLGDNRERSADSREHIDEGTQFISEKSLLSRIWLVWYPSIKLT